jgi:hypothetical protein
MILNKALLLLTLLAGSTDPDPDAERSTVVFTPETYSTMSFLYQRITAVAEGVEFAACLRAHREDTTWIVTEVVVPAQTGNSAMGIDSADCTGYEGAAHSHRLWEDKRACLPSFADRATFAASQNEFMVIWCDAEAFTFRTKDLGIGGKDDVVPDPRAHSSAEPHLWRAPIPAEQDPRSEKPSPVGAPR